MAKPIDEHLPDYAKLYLNHLVGRYRALMAGRGSGEADAEQPENDQTTEDVLSDMEIVKRVLNKNIDHPTWGDLIAFEITVLRRLSPEEFRREAHSVRQRYRKVAGHEAYKEYLKSTPPDPDKDDVKEHTLRADLAGLVTQINWLYASMPARERERNTLTKMAALIPAILLVVITASLAVSVVTDKPLSTPTYLMVLFVGAVGGAASMQIRLQRRAFATHRWPKRPPMSRDERQELRLAPEFRAAAIAHIPDPVVQQAAIQTRIFISHVWRQRSAGLWRRLGRWRYLGSDSGGDAGGRVL